jgi:hypothetical protein
VEEEKEVGGAAVGGGIRMVVDSDSHIRVAAHAHACNSRSSMRVGDSMMYLQLLSPAATARCVYMICNINLDAK